MSVKAMGLVWDMPCPSEVNGLMFKPGHKYVLLAYADHADHYGKNIWPAVSTVAKKTGYDDRSVQRLTNDLGEMGILVPDGVGPRGTNKWAIPFSAGGDKISPLTKYRGDKTEKSLGDIPSGDIPSGDKITPEFNEPKPEILINLYNDIDILWDDIKKQLKVQLKRVQYETWVEPTQADRYDGNTLHILTSNSTACRWLDANVKEMAQKLLGVYINFAVGESA